MRISFKQAFFNIIKNSLLRHILLITLGTAIFLPVYSLYFIFPKFSNQLTDYTKDASIRVTDLLRDTIFSNGTILTRQSFPRDVEKKILDVMKDLRVEQIKVFSKSGEVLFSSNSKDVGQMNTHDYFLTHVAMGKLYSKVVQKNSKTLEGRMVNAEVVETYVPLMSKNVFTGAIEVYYDITANSTSLTTLLDRLKIAIIGFSLIFLTVLFFILIKASRNVLERDMAETSLQRAHANLEKKVTKRTADLKKTNQSLTIEIEEHRISDLALRESEIRLKAILNANPDPMILYDLKGHPQYLNPAFTALFGWSLEELKGKTIPFVPEDQKQLSADKIKEIYEFGKALTFETKRLTKDSRALDILISAVVTRGMDGTLIGMIVNLTNISEKKAFETQYRQSQKLESIGTLAGGVAHDFNNILSGIIGYSQLAKADIQDPKKAINDIDQIIKGANRATDLVRQILTFSRQTEYKKQSLKISTLLKEALKLLRSSIPSTIEIKENIVSKASAIADPTQIHQVVMNLCTNAYQAMLENGGTLTVELKEIQVPGRDNIPELSMKPGKYLRLKVSDTGCGISPGTIDKIFDPYFTTKAPDKGTGLGLAVVHGIVKEHKGFIKVYSKPDQGTVFYVFLPVSEEKTSLDNYQDAVESQTSGNEKILFVDDDEDIRISSVEFLENQGYKVFSFSNGQDALQAFKKDPYQFDFIITDMTMPGLTGDVLASGILEIRPEIPIILCSGYSEKISGVATLKKGFRRFLQKPVNFKELTTIIRQELDGNSENKN